MANLDSGQSNLNMSFSVSYLGIGYSDSDSTPISGTADLTGLYDLDTRLISQVQITEVRIDAVNDLSFYVNKTWPIPDLTGSATGLGINMDSAGSSHPAGPAAVAAKLSRVCPLVTNNFVPDGNPDVPTFDTLSLQLILVTADGLADTIVWNKPVEGEGRAFARRPGRSLPTFLFHKTAYDELLATYDDLVYVDTTSSPQ